MTKHGMARFAPGLRVKLRLLDSIGTVTGVSGDWVSVKWDKGPRAVVRPSLCKRAQLEGVDK